MAGDISHNYLLALNFPLRKATLLIEIDGGHRVTVLREVMLVSEIVHRDSLVSLTFCPSPVPDC